MAHVVNGLEREVDFLARPPEAPRQVAADVIQLQVDSTSPDVLISSNVRSDHFTMLVDPRRSVDTATVEHSENTLQVPSVRSSKSRSYMFLHNLQRQGKAFYREAALADGPRHSEIWTATILVLDGPDGNIVGTYSEQASTKRGARDAASEQALAALGYASANETSPLYT
ncbi:hypothetical protein FS837_012409 [Tulasnella sp. UAMH 9824]|nr:hypothetical protein FS837_012409 [Tulasnella sp. UAMH 9824]